MQVSGSVPVITLQAVTRVYVTEDAETQALAQVSLETTRGEYISVAGPSGCGTPTAVAYARHASRHIHRFDGRIVDQPMDAVVP